MRSASAHWRSVADEDGGGIDLLENFDRKVQIALEPVTNSHLCWPKLTEAGRESQHRKGETHDQDCPTSHHLSRNRFRSSACRRYDEHASYGRRGRRRSAHPL